MQDLPPSFAITLWGTTACHMDCMAPWIFTRWSFYSSSKEGSERYLQTSGDSSKFLFATLGQPRRQAGRHHEWLSTLPATSFHVDHSSAEVCRAHALMPLPDCTQVPLCMLTQGCCAWTCRLLRGQGQGCQGTGHCATQEEGSK